MTNFRKLKEYKHVYGGIQQYVNQVYELVEGSIYVIY